MKKQALISVSDKTGVVDFARELVALGYHILSTGGTAKLLTKEGVSTGEFEGKTIVKVTPEALTLLANTAFRDVNFHLRRKHNEMLAKILKDPEASENDKYVALTFLRNGEVAAKGVLPYCQDTGTAIVIGGIEFEFMD